MKINSVKKTIYVTGNTTGSRRPRGEKYQIFVADHHIGTPPVYEWHTNSSHGQGRRTFALICDKEMSRWESILSKSTIESLEIRGLKGDSALEISRVSIRQEIRLSLTAIESNVLNVSRCRLKSRAGELSLLVYVPRITGGPVDAIVTEIEHGSEAMLRQTDWQEYFVELHAVSENMRNDGGR